MSPIKLISGFCGAVLLLTVIIAAFSNRSLMVCAGVIMVEDIQEEQSIEPTPPPAVEPEHE